jgi:hypothetical protein
MRTRFEGRRKNRVCHMKYTSEQKSAMKEVLADVISVISPHESILVRNSLDTLDFDGNHDMLSFDAGAAVELVLPYVLKLVKELASTTLTEVGTKFGKRLAEWLTSGTADKQKLEVGHLHELGENFRKKLTREGLARPEASRIADSLISTLVAHPELLRKIVGLPA